MLQSHRRSYGDTVVHEGAHVVQGDVIKNVHIVGGHHSHFHLKEIESLQYLVRRYQPQPDYTEDRQKSLLQLDTLSRVLQQAAEIVSRCGQDDQAHAETLKAIAFSTSVVLKDFHDGIQRSVIAESPIQNTTDDLVRAAGWNALSQHIRKLNQYLSSQLLCINGVLHLLQYETMQQVAQQANTRHTQLIQRFDLQNVIMHSLRNDLRPLADTFEENRQNIVALANHSRSTARTLADIQHTISRAPAFDPGDSINFLDALGRHFKLPFPFFESWQTFEGFLRNKFELNQIPGGHHVKAGSFLIAAKDDQTRVITKDNWKALTYPGCELTMSVVFTEMRLSMLRCPREKCGSIPDQSVEDGAFITCSNCGLAYRFDRSIELPSVADEGRRVQDMQQAEDARQFGERRAPVDFAGPPVDGLTGEVQTSRGYHTDFVDSQLYDFDSANQDEQPVDITPASPIPPAIDWNAGKSGLDAWLNSSAMPMNEPPSPVQDEYQEELDLRRREAQDLQTLKNVHFVALASETKPLVQSHPRYRQMSLESQVYLRKIADKFPALPMPLAERFARASVARKNRLRGLRTPDSPALQDNAQNPRVEKFKINKWTREQDYTDDRQHQPHNRSQHPSHSDLDFGSDKADREVSDRVRGGETPSRPRYKCDVCVRRKIKCDFELPCTPCIRSSRRNECSYERPRQNRHSFIHSAS